MYGKVLVLFTVVGVGLVSGKAQFPVSATTPSFFPNPTFAPGSIQTFGGNFGGFRSQFPTLRDFSNGEYATSNPFDPQESQECSLCKRKLNNTEDAVQIGFPKFSTTSQSVTSDFENNQVLSEDVSDSKQEKSDLFTQNDVAHRENIIIVPPEPTPSSDSESEEDSEKSQELEQNKNAYLPISSRTETDADTASQKSESKSADKPAHPTLTSYTNAPNPLEVDVPQISVNVGPESETSTNKPYGALSQTNLASNPVSFTPQSTGIPFAPISQNYPTNGFLGSSLSTGSPNIALPQSYSPYNFVNPYYSGISRASFSPAYSPYNFNPYSRGPIYSRPFGFNRFGYNPVSYIPRNRPSFYNNGYFANNRFGYSGVPQFSSYNPFGYNRNAFYQSTISPVPFRYQNSNVNLAQAIQSSTPIPNTFNAGQPPVSQNSGGLPLNYGAPNSVISPTFASPTPPTPNYSVRPGFGQPSFTPSSTLSPLQLNYQISNVNPTPTSQSSTPVSSSVNAGQSSISQTVGEPSSNYGASSSATSSTFGSSTPSTPTYSPGPLPSSVSGLSQSTFIPSSTPSPLQLNYQNSNANLGQVSQSSSSVSNTVSTGQSSVSQTVSGSPLNYGAPGFAISPTFASPTPSTPLYSAAPYSVSSFSQPRFFPSTTAAPFPISYQNSNVNTVQASQSSTPIPNTFGSGQVSVPQNFGRLPQNYVTPGSVISPTFASPTRFNSGYPGPFPYNVPGFRRSGFFSSTTPRPIYSNSPYSFSNFGQPSFASSTVATPFYSAAPFPQINYNGQPPQ